MMRRLLIPIVATAAVLLAGSSGARSAPAAPIATASCAHVKIGASKTCLVAGRACNPRYERQYVSHGFKCRRNTAGEYRLWQVPIKSLPPAV